MPQFYLGHNKLNDKLIIPKTGFGFPQFLVFILSSKFEKKNLKTFFIKIISFKKKL